MSIPIKPNAPRQYPLQLDSIKLYSTGPRGKIYTDHFYKLLNHNFGMEIKIKNNTAQIQTVKVTGCLYNAEKASGNTLCKWNKNVVVMAHSSKGMCFYVEEDFFSNMPLGKYKIQFWINGEKVKKQFFTLTSH